MIDLEFVLHRWPAVTLELSRLLEVRFVPGAAAQRTPVGQALNRVMHLQNQGDLLGRDTHYMRMLRLARDLSDLETADAVLLRVFRKKLLDPDLGNFFGTRFEIATAASLVRAGLRFTRRSSGGPDFEIRDREYLGVGIECTSCHMPQPDGGPHVVDKLHRAVMNKGREPYATGSNALAVDVTNLQAIGIDNGHGLLVSPHYESELAGIAHDSGFGSLLLFWLQTEVSDGKVTGLRSRFARADTLAGETQLLRLLDVAFAGKVDREPSDWRVPYMP